MITISQVDLADAKAKYDEARAAEDVAIQALDKASEGTYAAYLEWKSSIAGIEDREIGERSINMDTVVSAAATFDLDSAKRLLAGVGKPNSTDDKKIAIAQVIVAMNIAENMSNFITLVNGVLGNAKASEPKSRMR